MVVVLASISIQSLGSQNDKLKANYEAVRTELIHLREKHNTTRKQLLEAVESRVDADQRTETLVHKWKVQLEGRTRELESLQAKLVPQDLDMLRYLLKYCMNKLIFSSFCSSWNSQDDGGGCLLCTLVVSQVVFVHPRKRPQTHVPQQHGSECLSSVPTPLYQQQNDPSKGQTARHYFEL